MYALDNTQFIHGREGYHWAAVIVGCGGTGGFVAEGLARLLPDVADIVLVDFDRIEERNLIRQNFFPGEVGELKSAALAKRLSEKYNRPIAYSTLPINQAPLPQRGLFIGCVDNGLARQQIATRHKEWYWWVDAGNGENFGQILIGNTDCARFNRSREAVTNLPNPAIQRPEILKQAPPTPQLNCIDIPDQGPTVNQVMAAMTVEVVRRLIAGTCPWMQLMVDMDHGAMTPIMASPENCREIMHTKSKYKVQEE